MDPGPAPPLQLDGVVVRITHGDPTARTEVVLQNGSIRVLLTEQRDNALIVTVNRPQAMNALAARVVEDLHAWLREQGDWVPLGSADEQKPAKEGTVESWGRDPANPVGGDNCFFDIVYFLD